MTDVSAARWSGHGQPRPDLRALVEAARAGDGSAWEELYTSLYPRLFSYARRQLGAETGRDAVSEAMVRALSGLSRFSWQGAGFEAWLFRILRHVVVDHHRRNGRDRRNQPARQRDHEDDEVSDGLLADEEARAVRRAFDRLGPAERELLHLRVVVGLTSEEVAEVLGKRAGAVRMAQARSLTRLRTLLDEEAGR